MHTTTKVDKKWLLVTARVIPGVALPLLVGMNFRDGHAEDPDLQKKVNNLNAPKIFLFLDILNHFYKKQSYKFSIFP